ncbi:MAG TPA: iron ABC transporter permease [Devosia sp.]|nr:iron ABC transporter permease [Devosia sp.]
MSASLGRMTGTALPVIFVFVVIGVLSVLPLLRLVWAALAPGGVIDFTLFFERAAKASTLRATINTVDTAFFGAALALAIGVPFALLVAMSDMAGRKLAGFLLLLPLMVAPQVTALSWMHLLGPSSALLGVFGLAPPPGSSNPLLGRGGIIALYGFQHAPIVFITVRAGLAGIPRDYVEAGRAAGMRPLGVLFGVVLPLVRPYLAAAAALAFVAGIGNFGIPALLGMPVNYLTLTSLIYQQFSSYGSGVLPQVASLSILIGMVALVGVSLQGLALRGRGHRFTTGTPARFALGPWRMPAAILAFIVLFVTIALPILALIGTSLIPSYGVPLNWATLTFDNYVEVLTRQASTMRAFVNSTSLAGAAAVILALGAVPLAIALTHFSRRGERLVQGLVDLPYALPGIVLSIACILLFLKPLPLIGSLYGTAWIILIAYLMRFLALALKPVTTAIGQISHDLLEAAASSGAGPMRRLLTITAPLTLSAAVAGALLVFMTAFNELTVSALLWSGGHETLGVILFSLEEAGLATHAAAIAVTTIGAVVVLLLLIDRLGRNLAAGVLPWR